MTSSCHTERDEMVGLHTEVGEMIKNELISEGQVSEDCFHRWAAAAVIFARSRTFARSAALLLDEGYWETAGVLVRTLFEDAAVLAYIDARGEGAEEFARLYLLSDAASRLRYRGQLAQHGIRSKLETAPAVEELEADNERFRMLREELCEDQIKPAGPYQRQPYSWNYLNIANTFRTTGLGMQYDCCYAQLSDLLHSNAYAASYAYRQHLTPENEAEQAKEQAYRLQIEEWLVLALGMQLCYADELIAVRPRAGLPDLGVMMAAVAERHYRTEQ